MKVDCMLSEDQLRALAAPPGGLIDHKAGVNIAEIVRERRSTWRAAYVVGVWHTKGPAYRRRTARFYRDGRVEEVESA